MKASIIAAIGLGLAFTSSVAQAQGKNPPGVNPTHFLCYRVSQSRAAEAGSRGEMGKISSQFLAARSATPCFSARPVAKNGEEMKDKTTHLVCYQVQQRTRARK